MTKIANNVLTNNHKKAFDFFMESERYHGFELPKYFVFDKLLKYVRKQVGGALYEDCIQPGSTPEAFADVNLDILLNKDGHYAVRPIMLPNPYLYYFLVREVCAKQNWLTIQRLFKAFKVPHITSNALPVIPEPKEAFHKSTTIFNWWTSMEQRSIELSLEYRYMFVTDITNCYGSVLPESLEWAFTLKNTSLEIKGRSEVAQNIQRYLRAFQQGRNIGIPQGCDIFDFVGEIVLGYSDLLLHEALQAKKQQYIQQGKTFPQYEILRYRDDYRVFCNDRDALEDISYTLQQVLGSLNFRLNSQKTKISESIVTDSIKSDKLGYIDNTPIFNKKGVDFDSYEKHLIYILLFSRKYPNSGQVKTMLSDLDRRLEEWLNPKDEGDKTSADVQSDKTEDAQKKSVEPYFIPGGSIRAMAAVCTQIALENVGCSHYALRVLSRMVDVLKDPNEKVDILQKVYDKLSIQPNSSYNQLWLQNITYQQDKKSGVSPYTMRLCRVVAADKDVELWNNRWLKPELWAKLPVGSIVDKEELKRVTPVITFRESRGYCDWI